MDTQRLILVGATIVQLALWLVLAGRYQAPAPAPGTVVLNYGWKLRFLGLCIAFAIPMLMILMFAVNPMRHTQRALPFGLTILALGFVGGVLMVETQAVYLVVSDATIVGISPWRRRREWRWDQIERVTFSRLNRWLILHGPRGETIRAALALVGIRDLAQAILRRVSGPKCAPAARQIVDRLACQRDGQH